MIEKFKKLLLILALFFLFLFLCGTIGIAILCILFRNMIGFAMIVIFDTLLCVAIYKYSEEEI